MPFNPAQLGDPHLTLGPLRLWIHGREFESADDYWDGNWLRITAYCQSPYATTQVDGSILHLGDLSQWRDELIALRDAMTGSAPLPTIEPNLSICIDLSDGKGELQIKFRPEALTDYHEYRREIDQSYLPDLIQQLSRILREYPLRGQPE